MHGGGEPYAEGALCPAALRDEELVEAGVVEDPEDVAGASLVETVAQGLALGESADDAGCRGASFLGDRMPEFAEGPSVSEAASRRCPLPLGESHPAHRITHGQEFIAATTHRL